MTLHINLLKDVEGGQ